MRKGENAGYQQYLFFLTMFLQAFFFTVSKSQDCEVKGYKLFL